MKDSLRLSRGGCRCDYNIVQWFKCWRDIYRGRAGCDYHRLATNDYLYGGMMEKEQDKKEKTNTVLVVENMNHSQVTRLTGKPAKENKDAQKRK